MFVSGLQHAQRHMFGSAADQKLNHLGVQVGLLRDSAALEETQDGVTEPGQLLGPLSLGTPLL
jgi:hypothetical protein